MAESSTAEAHQPSSSFAKRLQEDLMTLTKARLSFLVVITALFGYFLAAKSLDTFRWIVFFDILVGTTLAAFGAAVFNQLMEVEVDARMARTSDRPLPANRFPRPLAFILGFLLAAFGLVHLGVRVNVPASAMAAATLLTYLFIYTPMKRVSSFNTIVGAVSGAIPPLIGWMGGGGSFLAYGAFYLFALLFFWQLPHFAAINWMYRDEYARGGFQMWSNDDETGRKTARIAIATAVCLVLLGFLFPILTPAMEKWGSIACAAPGAVMVWLGFRFFQSGERKDARSLFFYTLLYLPVMMAVSYLAWT